MELNIKDINWISLLLKRYKNLGLNENDTMVILMTDEIIQIDGDTPITADILSQYMALSKDEIDSSLMKLMDKKMVSYSLQNGNISLEPLFNKLLNDFKKDIVLASDDHSKKKVDDAYAFFQSELGRQLSPLEVDKITGWISEGATIPMMKEAYYNIQAKQKRVSFQRLEKEILRLEKEKDIGSEGFTARNEDHRDSTLPNVLSHDWVNND